MSRLKLDTISQKKSHNKSNKKFIMLLFIFMICLVAVFFYGHFKWSVFHESYLNAYTDQSFEYESKNKSKEHRTLFVGVDYQDEGHLSERQPMTIALVSSGNKVQFIHPERLKIKNWHTHPTISEINQLGNQVKQYLHTDIDYTLIVHFDNLTEWLKETGPLNFTFDRAITKSHLSVQANEIVQLNNRQLSLLMYPMEGESQSVYQQRQVDIWYQLNHHLSQTVVKNQFNKYSGSFFENVTTNLPESHWIKQIVLDNLNQKLIPQYK